MAFPKYTHDPDARLDYLFDWAQWLSTDEDTITEATVTGPDGITVEPATFTDTGVSAWVSGGSAGESYDLTCHIVTAAGREDDRSITLVCKER